MDSADVRRRLQQRREELDLRREHIDADLRSDGQPEGGFADLAVQRGNERVLEGIQAAAQAELQQIDVALQRLDAGLYDRCERCGAPISAERREIALEATRCTACAADGAS